MQQITSQTRRIWTLVIVSLGLFMTVLDNLVVNVALPSIHRDLGASIQTLEWTVNAYVPRLRGAAADRRGARRPVWTQADVHGRDLACSRPDPRPRHCPPRSTS